MAYIPDPNRYGSMIYNRCGNSGLLLPAISLGLWHNFGGVDVYENGKAILLKAFDRGVTHFDLADNYGPPGGSAEETFGKVLATDLHGYRDELIISTKAGHEMWPGPYGNFGGRKHLLAGLDQSLKRMGVEYVDIFYHHVPDEDTPLEETMAALAHAVHSGKALYAGISKYSPEKTREAAKILRELGTPCLIHQPRYNMFDRAVEKDGLLEVLDEEGIGSINFSPLDQGLLTDRYLKGVPEDSRASKSHGFLQLDQVTEEKRQKAILLNKIAESRGQTLAQMALVWCLAVGGVTSVLIGASRVAQLEDSLDSLNKPDFSEEELKQIEEILNG
ncbi:MAG: L-glyceraldehyde 3-phosphate reductase [Puniceicoccaceae bacterium]